MTSKRTKNAAATTDELDELFEGIGDERAADKKKPTPSSNKTKAGKGGAAAAAAAGPAAEKDILAELENELGEKQPASRPHTPRIAAGGNSGARGSPARKAAAGGAPSATPPVAEDSSTLPRRSAESTGAGAGRKSFENDNTAAASGGSDDAGGGGGGGGGWWGGLMSTATAAMKQAEAAVKEIQRNEEAKKWAEQVRGNYSALRGYGDELRHRAIPTFATILHTLAPPIAAHERLLIHITHDMVGYPSLDPLVHSVFARVMAQVEGGDLLVIQRGHENTAARADEPPTFFSGVGVGGVGGGGGAAPGWHDGPWWRAVDTLRDMGAVQGLHEGTKLCRASAESYAHEYYAAQEDGGLEQARQRAVEPMSETNPVRRSDLFLAVQAVVTTTAPAPGSGAPELFAGPAKAEDEAAAAADGAEAATEDDTFVSFAVYVLDPVHEIVFHTVSQTLPAKWVRWLDAPPTLTPATSVDDAHETAAAAPAAAAAAEHPASTLPDDIREIVEDGGVDPREWVAEWVEETLSLAVGVVAQRYVARRMGVGEGSIGRGKRQMHAVLEDGGGEAARAGLI